MKCAVLISLYNAEETLDKTFESLLAQTFQDFRIIAINDCSKDDTSNRLKKWEVQFGKERFFLLENEANTGLTKSLNKGLSFIDEPYTARIDADDQWHPEKLGKQIQFLENHPDYSLVGTWYKNISSKGSKNIILPETGKEIKKNIFKQNPFAHSCVVFRTRKIKEVGGYDETIYYGQDYDLWFRLLPEISFANIPEFLCFRNIENTLTSDGKNQKDQMLQCAKTRIKYLKRYKRSILEYRWVTEPILVAFAPQWLKKLKRKMNI